MSKLKVIASAIVAIGLAAVMAWLHFSNDSLRQENEGLKQALAELKKLSDVTTPAASEETMGDEQQAELLKLRAEVTQLRTQTNQIAVLTEANQKLRDSLRQARSSAQATAPKKKLNPEDALPQDIHPKDSWAYRGYATPDATVESTLWAMMNGDKETVLKAFAPDMQAKMEKQIMETKDFSDSIKKMNMAEFRVLDRQQLSPDEMVLTVYTARQEEDGSKVKNSQEQTVFQRINGEWKVTDKPVPDN